MRTVSTALTYYSLVISLLACLLQLFRLSVLEALPIDPQQRVLLEESYSALYHIYARRETATSTLTGKAVEHKRSCIC
jgi:hypothetical protein